MTERRRWADAPLQFVERPSCPHCGSCQTPDIVRSGRESDGSTWRRCVCRECSCRFVRVLEISEALPDSGKLEN